MPTEDNKPVAEATEEKIHPSASFKRKLTKRDVLTFQNNFIRPKARVALYKEAENTSYIKDEKTYYVKKSIAGNHINAYGFILGKAIEFFAALVEQKPGPLRWWLKSKLRMSDVNEIASFTKTLEFNNGLKSFTRGVHEKPDERWLNIVWHALGIILDHSDDSVDETLKQDTLSSLLHRCGELSPFLEMSRSTIKAPYTSDEALCEIRWIRNKHELEEVRGSLLVSSGYHSIIKSNLTSSPFELNPFDSFLVDAIDKGINFYMVIPRDRIDNEARKSVEVFCRFLSDKYKDKDILKRIFIIPVNCKSVSGHQRGSDFLNLLFRFVFYWCKKETGEPEDFRIDDGDDDDYDKNSVLYISRNLGHIPYDLNYPFSYAATPGEKNQFATWCQNFLQGKLINLSNLAKIEKEANLKL